ncbi:hypothetical protein HDV00_011865 [Rhizophlyctis rosea]|nr:hypothetical protein HDV00_011865 [Rhizophlyctis rosea]
MKGYDSGTTPQYLCPPTPPTVAFPELKDVNIQAWRDTDVGIPLPMNVSQGMTITNGIATIPGIYSTITYDATLYPHPALVCGMHNADYFEIGNTTLVGRNNTLAVWAPELYWDITHMIAAYATYIRKTRDANGMDTMAVHIRVRPNPASIGMDYPWIQRATFNCSASAPIWECPDHILFQDYQLSYLKDGRNMLRSLDDLELAYFENTGIKASMEIHPVVRKYTVYNGQNYAMPFALMFEPTKPGYLQWRGRYNEPKNFTTWMNSSMKDNPFDEPIFNWGTAFDTNTPVPRIPWQPGFALVSGYSLMKIFPPTGAAAVMPKLLGIANQTRNATLAFKVLMEAFARNNNFQVNCPSLNTNNAGGVSGYLAAPNIPEWLSTKKAFYDGMLDHAMAVGEPAAQSMSYGRISTYDPFQVALNDILYKNADIATALNRSCTIINFLTKPPCSRADMEPYLVDDPVKNSATLMYRWKDVRDCNETLPNAAAIPAPLVAAVPTAYLSTDSGLVKAMTGLAAACMAILLIFILMFFHKRDTKVMRAASRLFSFLILFGGEVTLASVIARISGVEKVGWPQCFGTYWFFAIGYGLVMGSLLVKTYRVDRIFRNKKMGFKLPDILLLAYVVFIILVEVAFLLVLQFKLDDPSYKQYIQIPLTETYVAQDACPKSSSIGPGLLYAWNGFIILLAAIYAFRTKNVNSDFNENKFTVAAIVLISVISIIIVPVLSIITNPNAIFLMVSLGTILGTFASTVVFAVPKLAIAYEVYSIQEAVTKIGNSTIASRIGTATMGSSTSPQASVRPVSAPPSAKSTVRKSTTADIHATSSAGGSSGTASAGKMV